MVCDKFDKIVLESTFYRYKVKSLKLIDNLRR